MISFRWDVERSLGGDEMKSRRVSKETLLDVYDEAVIYPFHMFKS